ncbi:hypothetical protein TH25_02435 [Thalassospira profundimaris]|uniref:EcsC family protein n=1 Tax=Thalassospira profundimaris TaxID=502049 RepID=A0A367XKK2_9PROT|nr:EcsC family protein [Thalassospira profundimaris]RCK54197.1 hypothetical protein TH25_02435 [Thalassospira profundimaris]
MDEVVLPSDGNVVKEEGKSTLLKAVEILVAEPKKIRDEISQMKLAYSEKHSQDKTEEEITEMMVEKIISNYSYYCAFSGGVTALTGVVPGLGTVVATFGGTTADIALTMKYQIEMTMAIASAYGRDITETKERDYCFLIAGLGALSHAAQEGGKQVGSKALVKMSQQYLTKGVLVAIKEVFKKIGITFTRKALEKSIPFGVGVVIGFSVNKGMTYYIGKKVQEDYSV